MRRAELLGGNYDIKDLPRARYELGYAALKLLDTIADHLDELAALAEEGHPQEFRSLGAMDWGGHEVDLYLHNARQSTQGREPSLYHLGVVIRQSKEGEEPDYNYTCLSHLASDADFVEGVLFYSYGLRYRKSENKDDGSISPEFDPNVVAVKRMIDDGLISEADLVRSIVLPAHHLEYLYEEQYQGEEFQDLRRIVLGLRNQQITLRLRNKIAKLKGYDTAEEWEAAVFKANQNAKANELEYELGIKEMARMNRAVVYQLSAKGVREAGEIESMRAKLQSIRDS